MTTVELELATTKATLGAGARMKALVYHGPGKYAWEDKPRPAIQDPGDAIVRITTTTICGTDLHILKGDLPAVTDGRILGHEGIGVVEQVGTGVSEFHVGDKVIISCVTACLKCDFCKRGMYSHCRHGGWILGYTLDGTQAEYVRIPQADGSLYAFPSGGDEEALVMLSDILPTGFECGVLNGKVKPGDTVAIVGAGPVGLAVLLTAQFYSPAAIFMIDLDDKRLAVAKQFGATNLINSADGHAAHHVMELTEGAGVDVAIEALGRQETFENALRVLRPGGTLSSLGVYSGKLAIPLESFAAGLGDHKIVTTLCPGGKERMRRLMELVLHHRIDLTSLLTHRFTFDKIIEAYELFSKQRDGVLKVAIKVAQSNDKM